MKKESCKDYTWGVENFYKLDKYGFKKLSMCGKIYDWLKFFGGDFLNENNISDTG